MKQKRKNSAKRPKNARDLSAERAERGQATEPGAADQRGATEQQVQPLTPPTAEAPERQPSIPRKRFIPEAENEIDPADELTPG